MPQIGKLFISSFVSDDYNNHHKIAHFWHTTMSKIITSATKIRPHLQKQKDYCIINDNQRNSMF
jgi:hypothetical protein